MAGEYKDLPIQIARIRIKNFRIIRELDMDFGKHINVFVGINGSGKSTLLEALKFLFSWLVARVNNVKGRGMMLSDNDITVGENYCLLEVLLSSGYSWKIYKQRSSDRSKPVDKSDFEQLTEFANAIVMSVGKNESIPLFAKYGVNRAVTEMPLRLKKRHALEPMQVYDSTSLNSGVNFRSFFEWFREREDIENEMFRHTGTLREDRQLKAVRVAMSRVFPDYGELVVKRSPRAFLMRKGDHEFRFEQLSDGEKCYITLVADISRRLAMANPESEHPLDGNAVILIDEVDLHLHPSWQSEIIAKLREIFTGCQFFITTHSPFVVSNVKTFDNEKLYSISDGHVIESATNPFGQSVDAVLLEAFGMASLRNKEVQEHISRIWECLSKKDTGSETFADEMNWLGQHLDKSDSEFFRIALEIAKIRKGTV